MNITKKAWVIILLVILVGAGAYMYSRQSSLSNNQNVIPTVTPNPTATPTPELMSLNLYLQDREAAQIRDCGITYKATYQIPRTQAVADASLKLLFQDELAGYGVYNSVTISNSVAKVMLTSDRTPDGTAFGSLSSCEQAHLFSVLRDTLTQYESIKTVELYSPKGRIET